MTTSPPQHCWPCSARALSLRDNEICAGAVSPCSSIARALATAVASRLPPPMLSKASSAVTTILAPASRGAWPRTVTSVTSTPARRSPRNRSTAASQCTSGPTGGALRRQLGVRPQRPVVGVGLVRHDPGGAVDHVAVLGLPGAPAAGLLQRPPHRLRCRGRRQVDAGDGGPERRRGLPQGPAHREGK